MTHAAIEPDLACPGELRADRYRHRRSEKTHAWRCSVCGQRFTRYHGDQYTVGHSVTPQRQAELIREATNDVATTQR